MDQKFPTLVEIRAANSKEVAYKRCMIPSWTPSKWYHDVESFRFWFHQVIPQRPAIRPFGTSLDLDNADSLPLLNEILSSFSQVPGLIISAGIEDLSVLYSIPNNETMQLVAELIRSGALVSFQTLQVSLARGLSSVPGCRSLGEPLNSDLLPHLRSLYIPFEEDRMEGEEDPTIEVWQALLEGISRGSPAGLEGLQVLRLDSALFFCRALTSLENPMIVSRISEITLGDRHIGAEHLDMMSEALSGRFLTCLETLIFHTGKQFSLCPVFSLKRSINV